MHRKNGFSLIELLAVVAIIGILAAIAFPSYDYAVRKANRGAAQSTLMDIAQRQQQFLLDNRSYSTTVAGLNMTVPAEVSRNYNITLPGCAAFSTCPLLAAPCFRVIATPISGSKQVSDGSLSVDNTGCKTPPDKW